MTAPQTHDDIRYHVDDASGRERVFSTFESAASFAVVVAAMKGETVYLDVVVWSEQGARCYGGDDAVNSYREDPEASVFERYEIRVEPKGRVA
jgi:hypothetical protein